MGKMRCMWVLVMVVPSMLVTILAADPDPLQDFCVADNSTGLTINGFPCKPAGGVTVEDFVFTGLKNGGDTNNAQMIGLTSASVIQFPGLNTLGVSAARIDFAKEGSVNVPHVHPRASEVFYLLKGEVYLGFVTTNNTLFATVLKAGELFVIPKGLVHFQLNVGKSSALAFAAFSSQFPGRQEIASALFKPDMIKDDVLQKGFRIDAKTVDKIQAEFNM